MNPIESRYNGICDIYEMVSTLNNRTNITSQSWDKKYSQQPCRMVVESNPATVSQYGAPAVSETITLLISPDIDIYQGSYIEVTQEGRTECFKCSGIPAVYRYHQEVTLERAERWA